MQLPEELKHLEKFSEYARPIRKGLWGFYINQWNKDGTLNLMWLEFRNYTLGASDVSCTLGINPYKSMLRLHWDKVENKIREVATMLMIVGHSMEDHIAKYWEHWDGDDWIENYQNRDKQRTSRNLNCFVINEKYPYLAVSYDRIVNAGQANPHTGEVMKYNYPLEIKNISKFSKATGISPFYLVQVCVQQMVWEVDYSEWVANIGNANLVVLDVDGREGSPLAQRLKDMKDHIHLTTTAFMSEVYQAKDIYNELQITTDPGYRHELEEQLNTHEPSGIEAIEDVEAFLKERYSPDSIELNYTEEYLSELCQAQVNAEYLGNISKQWKQSVKNHVLKMIDSNGVIKTDGASFFKYIPADETRKRSYYKANVSENFVVDSTLEMSILDVNNLESMTDKYFKD